MAKMSIAGAGQAGQTGQAGADLGPEHALVKQVAELPIGVVLAGLATHPALVSLQAGDGSSGPLNAYVAAGGGIAVWLFGLGVEGRPAHPSQDKLGNWYVKSRTLSTMGRGMPVVLDGVRCDLRGSISMPLEQPIAVPAPSGGTTGKQSVLTIGG